MQYLWGLFTDRRTNKELRVFGADDYILEQWRAARDETQAEIWEQARKDAVSFVICDAFRILGYGACIALALWLTLSGTVSVGVFGACIAAFIALQTQTMDILVNSGSLPSSLAFAADYFEFKDLPAEPSGGMVYNGLQDKIEVRGVRFRYPNAEGDAVWDLSLTIRKGEKIAILGENGSGKTTFTKLLLGLLPVSSGEILYDGVNVDDLEKNSFHRTLSAVSQNFVRYTLPLRENIAMSDVERINDDAAIEAALCDAGLGELLDEAGLDTELGNAYGGADVSGGQWQKLAIARGLFRPSELIILDEPTSALDPLIETEILSKFVELAHNKTAVIISHRVGLCRLVDKIAVMKDGTLVEFGSHAGLLAENGEYARLFKAQEKWYR
jgi:ABC-type multidrug transport system fused ATPase/permease subunit